MLTMDDTLMALRLDILKIAQRERERLDLLNSPLPPALKDERDQDLKNDIERLRHSTVRLLWEIIEFPPYHVRHQQFLNQFHTYAPFDRSVFVMTKFPNPNGASPADLQLKAVIQAVRDAVESSGYVARIADDAQYHGLLWDNVELYLLGCKRGIAIVEDKYCPELNPNVAMEWGWMRGMGRKVLYLVEQDFQHQRADWGGLLEARFDWSDPVPEIKAAVEAWLKNP